MARKFKLLKDISTFDVEAKAGTIGIEKIEPTGSTDSKVWFDNGRFFYRLSTVNTWKDWFEEIKEEPVQPLTEKTVMEFMSEIEERFNGTGITLFREWREFRRRKQSEQPPSLKDNVLSSGEAIDITLKPSTNEGRDWEILVIQSSNGGFARKTFRQFQKGSEFRFVWDADPNGMGYYEDFMLSGTDNKIYSVKRLSDGEVFTVGDEVRFKPKSNYGSFIVTNFFITPQNKMLARSEGNNYCEFVDENLQKLSPSSTNDKEPLFTTEDGKEIFEGDDYWVIRHETTPKWAVWAGKAGTNEFNHPRHHPEDKYFSTRESAEDFVTMNKPCLSANDVLALDVDIHIETDTPNLSPGDGDVIIFEPDSLKQLAKSKSSQ